MNVSGSTTSAVSATGGASRTFRSRASSVHRVSHTTVADMVAALQAEFAALRQLRHSWSLSRRRMCCLSWMMATFHLSTSTALTFGWLIGSVKANLLTWRVQQLKLDTWSEFVQPVITRCGDTTSPLASGDSIGCYKRPKHGWNEIDLCAERQKSMYEKKLVSKLANV